MRYLILGGGITGTTAAEELRKRDPEAEITLLSEEMHVVYSRVLLPHYLKKKVPRERVFLKKPDWYQTQNIEWLPGVLAEHVDVVNQFVRASDGREYPYDKLLIATGGEVRYANEDRPGVSYFRTLDDADHLVELLNAAPKGAKAAAYGAGFITCEYVNLFAQEGLSTTVALRGDRFWSQHFDATLSDMLFARLRAAGMEVKTGATELPEADIVGVGIGIIPDFSILEGAGIETGAGVKTNEFLETNIPNVWSAGDGAEFYDVYAGRQLMAGNWMSAMTQGRVVAANMFGERTAFKLVSSYATNLLGLEIIFVGDTQRSVAEEIKVIGNAEEGMTHVMLRGGKVVGGIMVGRNGDRAAVTNAIKEGKGWE